MTHEEFEQLVAEEFPKAIPEKFHHLIKNVAFLIEEEPSMETRMVEGLGPNETLLGYYKGVPATARGDHYGVGSTLPDTITLFRLPILHEAMIVSGEDGVSMEEALPVVIRETIWHEVAHYFGMDEGTVSKREAARDKMKRYE